MFFQQFHDARLRDFPRASLMRKQCWQLHLHARGILFLEIRGKRLLHAALLVKVLRVSLHGIRDDGELLVPLADGERPVSALRRLRDLDELKDIDPTLKRDRKGDDEDLFKPPAPAPDQGAQ